MIFYIEIIIIVLNIYKVIQLIIMNIEHDLSNIWF